MPFKRGGYAMKRYFFEVVSGNDSAFDYHGHEFALPEKAIEFARLMALYHFHITMTWRCRGRT